VIPDDSIRRADENHVRGVLDERAEATLTDPDRLRLAVRRFVRLPPLGTHRGPEYDHEADAEEKDKGRRSQKTGLNGAEILQKARRLRVEIGCRSFNARRDPIKGGVYLRSVDFCRECNVARIDRRKHAANRQQIRPVKGYDIIDERHILWSAQSPGVAQCC
jgi:hypothetical protein